MMSRLNMETKSWKQTQRQKKCLLSTLEGKYCTRAFITRSLYTFYPIFEGQKRFLRSFFRKILTLCTVSIQERFQIKSVRYVKINNFNFRFMLFFTFFLGYLGYDM